MHEAYRRPFPGRPQPTPRGRQIAQPSQRPGPNPSVALRLDSPPKVGSVSIIPHDSTDARQVDGADRGAGRILVLFPVFGSQQFPARFSHTERWIRYGSCVRSDWCCSVRNAASIIELPFCTIG